MNLKEVCTDDIKLKHFLDKHDLNQRELLFMIFLELVRSNRSKGVLTQPNRITDHLKENYGLDLDDIDEHNW